MAAKKWAQALAGFTRFCFLALLDFAFWLDCQQHGHIYCIFTPRTILILYYSYTEHTHTPIIAKYQFFHVVFLVICRMRILC